MLSLNKNKSLIVSTARTACPDFENEAERTAFPNMIFVAGERVVNDGGLLVGSTFTLSCADNYVLSDSRESVITCQLDGNWDGAPTCVKSLFEV